MKRDIKKDEWLTQNLMETFNKPVSEHFDQRLMASLNAMKESTSWNVDIKRWKKWFFAGGIVWAALLVFMVLAVLQVYQNNFYQISWWIPIVLGVALIYFRSIITFVLLFMTNQIGKVG